MLAASLAAALVACGGGSSSGSLDGCVASSTVSCIGPGGGTVSSGGATVSVPANALTTTLGISVVQDSTSSPGLPVGTSAAGLVWQLLPHGTVFAQPVTITLPFDPTALAPGAVPHLYKAQPGGAYTEITPITVSGSTITAQVSSFSYFASTTNKAPVALLTMPAGSAFTGQTLSFSASGSSDTEGPLASYRWDFGDGSTPEQGSSLTTATHSFGSAGNYAVSLTVTDALGLTQVAAATLNVTQTPPTCTAPQVLSAGVCVTPNQSPTASVATQNTAPITGQEVLLDPASSADADGSIASYEWSFGDGSSASSSTAAVQYKSWPSPGAKTVTLTVTDNLGAINAYALIVNVASYAPTGTLNDTGIDWCSENITTPSTWVNNAVCSAVNWVGNLWGQQQDAFFGRDAQARAGTLTKVGAGMAGFDFTKLGADGRALATQNGTWSDAGTEALGTRWDCVRDNTTGLIWEVKRNDATHLRHLNHSYGWYSPDAASNGGAPGYPNNADTGASCTGVADTAKCNTQSFVTAVNALPSGQALCGFRDWRMPVVDELRNLAHTGVNNPAIDSNYFPNTVPYVYWSSSPYAGYAGYAWLVYFYDGGDGYDGKSYAFQVRLVRSGQ